MPVRPYSVLAVLPVAAGLLFCGGSSATAQQFDADFSTGNIQFRTYVANNKIRMERTINGLVAITLVDTAAHTAIALRPDKQWVIPMGDPGVLSFYTFLAPTDPNDACPQWEQLNSESYKAPKIICQKVGPDTIDGRDVIKYEIISAKDERATWWVDPKLRFVMKCETANGIELLLTNIREGNQPDSLFEVPAGYHRPTPTP